MSSVWSSVENEQVDQAQTNKQTGMDEGGGTSQVLRMPQKHAVYHFHEEEKCLIMEGSASTLTNRTTNIIPGRSNEARTDCAATPLTDLQLHRSK